MPVSQERLVVQLRTLMDLSAALNSTLDATQIRRKAVEAVTAIVDAERSSLLVLDPDTSDLCFEVMLEGDGTITREVRLAPGEGIAGWVVANGVSAIVPDVAADPRYRPASDSSSPLETRDMLCVPVFARGVVVGALQAMNKREGTFDDNDREIMEALGHHVGVAIENANLYRGLKEAFYQTAEALADTVEKADPYTGAHVRRVMAHALAIAGTFDLPEDEVEGIRLAAVLHDIGKVGVPETILRKAEGLDEAELETMRRHCETGSEILQRVNHLHPVMAAVRAHHERFDGTGYPDGLCGEEIPLPARIIAVADAFDAMTTDRPYRAAIAPGEAVEELRACAGSQFDPAIVDAFTRIVTAAG